MKTISTIFALVIFVILGVAFTAKQPSVSGKKEKLSEYGFFTGNLAELNPAEDVVPYQLNSSLFSNYAEKARFIKLPAGLTAQYNRDSVFGMPVGTILIKNFYYPADFRNPSKGRKILETRLLVHEQDGWNALPYIWNDEQTEAFYDVAGDVRKISYIDAGGKKVSTSYAIPNKNQCRGCHSNRDQLIPIGIAARHLNREYTFADGTKNQLEYWQQKGMLTGLPSSGLPANSKWDEAGSGSVESRARAYLDINCGHCHQPNGAANTSGLMLDMHTSNPTALGIMKTPVAAGRGSGNLDYDIYPGHPDKSILVFRMNTTDPGIAMPEIGREQIHKEGVELVRQWIKGMK
ncbi:SO2930 family diheme c-type cytochrome [Flavihumibacter solisilvae]|uniref:Lipoprotein n=1 Tax=Flavihumibacter solisilvae TaxID=1349421 RepID=A0A0C1LK23_9BACT|nr:SO2930 family diheme c-type cytochrome [Flavihumibacter solisilvae]KIC95733.1 lipoprotein [Flavihumibacter solisilvae]